MNTPADHNISDHLIPVWHVFFYLVWAGNAFIALNQFPLDNRAIGIAAFSALAVWYATSISRDDYWATHPIRYLFYLAVGWLLWSPLAAIDAAHMMMLAAFFPLIFVRLPLRWAIVGATMLSGLVVVILSIASGEEAIVSLLLGAGMVLSAIVLGGFINAIVQQSEARHDLIRQLQATRESLATAEAERVLLQERQRIANEIHDTLAQAFSGILMHLDAAEAQPDTAQLYLGHIRQIARDNLAEARRFVWQLRPEVLAQESLPTALRSSVMKWCAGDSIQPDVIVTGRPYALLPMSEVAILRVAQEAISNSRKHAKASTVRVTLSFTDNAVLLDVWDDGIGFAPNEQHPTALSGLGLQTMRERVEQVGGTFAVESNLGDGTIISINIPTRNDSENTDDTTH